MQRHWRYRVIPVMLFFIAAGCAGNGPGGCSCVQPLAGGFPKSEQLLGAVQLRLTQSGLDMLEQQAPSLITGLLPSGLNFDVPPSCGISAPVIGDINVCGQPKNGSCKPTSKTCRIEAAIKKVELIPQATVGDVLRVNVRIAAKTAATAPIFTNGAAQCQISLDTAVDGKKDVGFRGNLRFKRDTSTDRFTIDLEQTELIDLDEGDIQISGDFLCTLGDLFFKGSIVDTLKDQFNRTVKGLLESQLCAQCGADGVCPGGSTCDANSKKCLAAGKCVQRLGVEGRMQLGDVLGVPALSDLLVVPGSDVKMPLDGVTLGTLSGFSAPGEAHPCITAAPDKKPLVTTAPVPFSSAFTANTAPDGHPYHLGIGIHQTLLDFASWSLYTSGRLCLQVSHENTDMLRTDSFAIVMPSIVELAGQQSVPVRLAIIPNEPPQIQLGAGTFKDDGQGGQQIVDPLFRIKFKALNLDMYAQIDNRFVRIVRIRADVTLPMSLTANGNKIEPVVGDLNDAFENLSVTESALVSEENEAMAAKFPVILKLAFGYLPQALSQGFNLPNLAGMQLQQPQFTSVDNQSMLGIFAQLSPKLATPTSLPIRTPAQLEKIDMPKDPAVMSLRRRQDVKNGPVVWVRVDPTRRYSWRLDDTTWSTYAQSSLIAVRSPLLFLAGKHTLQLRSDDQQLEQLTFDIAAPQPINTPTTSANGSSDLGGCAMAPTDNSATNGTVIFWLAVALMSILFRRRNRLVMAIFLAGCSSATPTVDQSISDGGPKTGDACTGECNSPLTARGVFGKFSSLGTKTSADGVMQLVASAYDSLYGDLVVVAAPVTNLAQQTVTYVDGVPTKGPRDGISAPGDNVGEYTALRVNTDGHIVIAYHDATNHALKFATDHPNGTWQNHTVQLPDGKTANVGLFNALTFQNGTPAIAYVALNVRNPDGTFQSELRLARTTVASPTQPQDWKMTRIDHAPASCAGLCDKSEACVATSETSNRCMPIGTTCTQACNDGQACVENQCVRQLDAPKVSTLPSATGLWVNLLLTSKGELILVYHDRTTGQLKVATPSGEAYQTTVVATGTTQATVGAYCSATLDSNDLLHVVYQDDRTGSLRYQQINIASPAAGPAALIDDGRRADGHHPVGADAAVILDAAGRLRVIYQDQRTADLLTAVHQDDNQWLPNDSLTVDPHRGRGLKIGDPGYGFFGQLARVGDKIYGSSYVIDAKAKHKGYLEFFPLAD